MNTLNAPASVLIAGLTGGFASGKSSVASILSRLGAHIIDADELAREAVLAGSAALSRISAEFGPTMLEAEGALNRRAMAELVFSDPASRRRLEQIIHPEVERLLLLRLDEARRSLSPPEIIVCVVPLLYESEINFERHFDVIIAVSSPDERRIERAQARDGCTRDMALRRIAAQMPQDLKEARADFVIRNNGSLAELETAASDLYSKLAGLRLAGPKA